MTYEYKMVQIPPNIEVRGAPKGQEAAWYLQDIVNKMAKEGWEFYRVDEVGVVVQPGCLGMLFGQILCRYLPQTCRWSKGGCRLWSDLNTPSLSGFGTVHYLLPDGTHEKLKGSYAEVVALLTKLGYEGWEVATSVATGNWILWTLKRRIP